MDGGTANFLALLPHNGCSHPEGLTGAQLALVVRGVLATCRVERIKQCGTAHCHASHSEGLPEHAPPAVRLPNAAAAAAAARTPPSAAPLPLLPAKHTTPRTARSPTLLLERTCMPGRQG